MILLAVETSGSVGSIALRCNGRCVEERFLPELGRRHAQSLVPETVAFLRQHGLSLRQLNAVAVSVGPGSFTGLRIGLTFAKTLAYAAGAKLAAIETFEAIAANTPAVSSVAVVADAQRAGLMFGIYDRTSQGSFVRRGALRLVAPDALSTAIAGVSLLTGPGLDRVDRDVSCAIELAGARLRRPRASVVAGLGELQLARGAAREPWTLEPLYVRQSAAEEKAAKGR